MSPRRLEIPSPSSPWRALGSGSNTICTARSRISGEKGVLRLVMAPSSQELKPQGKPARFNMVVGSTSVWVALAIGIRGSCKLQQVIEGLRKRQLLGSASCSCLRRQIACQNACSKVLPSGMWLCRTCFGSSKITVNQHRNYASTKSIHRKNIDHRELKLDALRCTVGSSAHAIKDEMRKTNSLHKI